MSVADKLGLGPTRSIRPNGDGSYTLSVTPPIWLGDYPTKSVHLSPAAYKGYHDWLNGAYIQVALSMLSADDREIILNGGVEV